MYLMWPGVCPEQHLFSCCKLCCFTVSYIACGVSVFLAFRAPADAVLMLPLLSTLCCVSCLITAAVVLGSHSPLLPMLGPHSSPTNSSQSDTATTADAQLSLGSAGAAADVVTGPKNSSAGKTAGMSAHSHASTLAAGNAHAGHMYGQHGQHSNQGGYDPKREWLYRLVTFPHYFTPCVSCCNGSNTPKREQLMTLFDTRAPHRVFCCHCPTPKGSTGHFSASHGRDGALLQVRTALDRVFALRTLGRGAFLFVQAMPYTLQAIAPHPRALLGTSVPATAVTGLFFGLDAGRRYCVPAGRNCTVHSVRGVCAGVLELVCLA